MLKNLFYVFEFSNGSNPYIVKTAGELFRMFCKYDYMQTGEKTFFIIGLRQWNGKKTYKGKKEMARGIAINWQNDFDNMNYSYRDLAQWGDFFEEIGRKYGLLEEFRENAIC